MDRDDKLVGECLAGSQEAFSEIVRQYQVKVRMYLGSQIANRAVVDDLAQEVFVSAYSTLKSYRRDAPLLAWLLGIARHHKLHYFRQEARRRKQKAGLLESALSDWQAELGESVKADADQEQRQISALEHCLGQLPERGRSLIREHYFDRVATATIAERLGRGDGAVRTLLYRARQALRMCMESSAGVRSC